MKLFFRRIVSLKFKLFKIGLALSGIIVFLYNYSVVYSFTIGKFLSPFIQVQAARYTENAIYGISIELYRFREEIGRFPSNQEGLEILYERLPSPQSDDRKESGYDFMWHPPFQDAWKRPYQYVSPGFHHPEGFDLFSLGEDSIKGTIDDINNWDESKPWKEYYRQRDWWIEKLVDFWHRYLIWFLFGLLTVIVISRRDTS